MHSSYDLFSHFLLRTPLLELNYLEKIDSDSDVDWNFIKELYRKPLIQEAIYIASPNLFEEYQKWFTGSYLDDVKWKKKERKLKTTLLLYLSRMITRPTPFGLFAGVTIGDITTQTGIELKSSEKSVCKVRFDMDYLCALMSKVSTSQVVKSKALYYPNNGIYKIMDALRFVEYKYSDTIRKHDIVSVDDSTSIQKVLKQASLGATISELVDTIMDREITENDAIHFIDSLIESQILYNKFEPQITGEDLLVKMINELRRISGPQLDKALVNKLENADSFLRKLIVNSTGNKINTFKNIEQSIKKLPLKYNRNFLFQVDMLKRAEKCTIDNSVVYKVIQVIDFLNKIKPKYINTNLNLFKEAFRNRYENQEVQLLKVLDPEFGIGYLQNQVTDFSPLVDNIILENSEVDYGSVKLDKLSSILQKYYIKAIKNHSFEVKLKDDDFEGFTDDISDLPKTLSILCQFYGNKGNEPLIFLKAVGGSSAANLLGRFCYLDKDIKAWVTDIITEDQKDNSDVLHAEIVHLPQNRTGNILMRPTLHNYEIPYLTLSGVENEHQIPIDDLYVSITNEEIILKSKRFNKIVIPHLTCAHNYSSSSLPVYRFLCDLQFQNQRPGLKFAWGTIFYNLEFLPRVSYHGVILQLATWFFSEKDTRKLLEMKIINDKMIYFNTQRENRNIPERVLFEDGEDSLYLNLSKPSYMEILIRLIKNRKVFSLCEFLDSAVSPFVKGESGNFSNEVIFTIKKS